MPSDVGLRLGKVDVIERKPVSPPWACVGKPEKTTALVPLSASTSHMTGPDSLDSTKTLQQL